MIPIEQAPQGALVFLQCGCAGWQVLAHPTRAAFLVRIIEPACEAHGEPGPEHIWSLKKGELVTPFARELMKQALREPT